MFGGRGFLILWVALVFCGIVVGKEYGHPLIGGAIGFLLPVLGSWLIAAAIGYWQPVVPMCMSGKCKGYEGYEFVEYVAGLGSDADILECRCGNRYVHTKGAFGNMRLIRLEDNGVLKPYLICSAFGRWRVDTSVEWESVDQTAPIRVQLAPLGFPLPRIEASGKETP